MTAGSSGQSSGGKHSRMTRKILMETVEKSGVIRRARFWRDVDDRTIGKIETAISEGRKMKREAAKQYHVKKLKELGCRVDVISDPGNKQ